MFLNKCKLLAIATYKLEILGENTGEHSINTTLKKGNVMNRKLKISGFQFCTIFLFEVGSSSLVALAPQAKQDAWISLLIALILGC